MFCDIANGDGPFIFERPDVVAIVPLNPVTAGHVIFIPKAHVPDACVDPSIAGDVMEAAAWYVAEQEPINANIITSIGEAATQTVMHLHVHVVPRRPGDGLALPWTGQKPLCGVNGCTNPKPAEGDYESCFYDGSPCQRVGG